MFWLPVPAACCPPNVSHLGDIRAEWSTLIGQDSRDTALIGRERLIELKYFHDNAGASSLMP